MMSACPWDVTHVSDGGDAVHEEGARDMELILNLPESPFVRTSSPVELQRGAAMKRADDKGQDRSTKGCGQ